MPQVRALSPRPILAVLTAKSRKEFLAAFLSQHTERRLYMSKFINYMKEIGLTDLKKIHDYFMKISLETIVPFHVYMQNLAYEDWSISDYSPYSFAPSMSLSGFGGCAEYKCKINRATTFHKFAALYSDTVYFFVNSITNPHPINFIDNPKNEMEYREDLKNDFSLIFLYSDLIEYGIAKIIPPHFSVCPHCFSKLILDKKELSLLEPLINDYTEKAVISALNYIPSQNTGIVSINIPELFPDHPVYRTIEQSTERNFFKNLKTFPVNITDKHFKNHIVKQCILDNFVTTKFEAFISSSYRSKLITDKPFDQSLLGLSSNRITASLTPPVFNMPFLEGIQTETILKIRESEQHAFNEYRIAMDNATHAYIKATQTSEIEDIQNDIIYPAFIKLDSMFARTQKMKAISNIGSLLVTSATVTLGVMNSIIPQDVPSIITAVGGTEALLKYLMSVIERKSNTDNDIEKQDFYFLWKINQKK